MSHGACIFFRILRRFGHKVLFLISLLSCIFGFHEKRTEHISFLAFQTNFLKRNKSDARASHPVDINML